jgi:glutaredoxin-dependent peroxiredoxin
MNPVLELLNKRWAGRAISSEPLSEEVLKELMEAVRLTPSCYNKQPWRFLFLKSDESRKKGVEVLADGNKTWASRAPLLVIGYSRRTEDCELPDGRAYHQFDLGMSVMDLMLSATHHGLVARPMAGFDPAKAKELFGLEAPDEPLVMVAIGKPSQDESHLPKYYQGLNEKPRERKESSQIIKTL